MKLLAAPAVLFVMLSFCTLTDKNGTNSQKVSDSPAVSTGDREATKNELLRLINDVADAAVKGDRSLLTASTTEDFQLIDSEGRVLDKKQALAEVKKENSITSWTITEAELTTLTDDTAAMKFLITINGANGRTVRARVTDTFAREDGRWLLKSEQQTLVR